MKRLILCAVAALALAACEDKKTETKPEDPAVKNAPSATATAADTAKTTATPTTVVSINDSDIATPADFEDSAEKSIDKKNYKTELTTLETDIAKD